jgi:hypothetical protein
VFQLGDLDAHGFTNRLTAKDMAINKSTAILVNYAKLVGYVKGLKFLRIALPLIPAIFKHEAIDIIFASSPSVTAAVNDQVAKARDNQMFEYKFRSEGRATGESRNYQQEGMYAIDNDGNTRFFETVVEPEQIDPSSRTILMIDEKDGQVRKLTWNPKTGNWRMYGMGDDVYPRRDDVKFVTSDLARIQVLERGIKKKYLDGFGMLFGVRGLLAKFFDVFSVPLQKPDALVMYKRIIENRVVFGIQRKKRVLDDREARERDSERRAKFQNASYITVVD